MPFIKIYESKSQGGRLGFEESGPDDPTALFMTDNDFYALVVARDAEARGQSLLKKMWPKQQEVLKRRP